jgi:hypothetical protein
MQAADIMIIAIYPTNLAVFKSKHKTKKLLLKAGESDGGYDGYLNTEFEDKDTRAY